MWPPKWLKRVRSQKLIARLGAHEFQLWTSKSGTLSLMNKVPSDGVRFDQWEALRELLKELLAATSANLHVDIIVDTKWMPMCLLNVGQRPISQRTITALAQHRFCDIFGERAKTWSVQVDYLPGECNGVAFACPQELIEGIRQACAMSGDGGVSLGAIQSTFVWTNNTCIKKAKRSELSCIVLREQDRSIFAFHEGNKLIGLHPSGPLIDKCAKNLVKEAHILANRCALVFETQSIELYSFESIEWLPAEAGVTLQVLQQEEMLV